MWKKQLYKNSIREWRHSAKKNCCFKANHCPDSNLNRRNGWRFSDWEYRIRMLRSQRPWTDLLAFFVDDILVQNLRSCKKIFLNIWYRRKNYFFKFWDDNSTWWLAIPPRNLWLEFDSLEVGLGTKKNFLLFSIMRLVCDEAHSVNRPKELVSEWFRVKRGKLRSRMAQYPASLAISPTLSTLRLLTSEVIGAQSYLQCTALESEL